MINYYKKYEKYKKKYNSLTLYGGGDVILPETHFTIKISDLSGELETIYLTLQMLEEINFLTKVRFRLDQIVESNISYIFLYTSNEQKNLSNIIVYTDYNSDDDNNKLLKDFHKEIKRLIQSHTYNIKIMLNYYASYISHYITLVRTEGNNPNKAFFYYNSLEEKSKGDACLDIIDDTSNITVLADIPVIDMDFKDNKETLIMENLSKNIFLSKKIFFDFELPNLTTIDDNFLAHYSNLCQLIFEPPGFKLPKLTTINSNFMRQCINLEIIIIPNSVTNIHNFFCNFCFNLVNVILSNSLTNIGNYFLTNCIKLKQLNLPNLLTIIGSDFLKGCKELKKLNLSKSLNTIGNNFLIGCNKLEKLELPDSLTTIGNHFCNNCNSLKIVKLPNSLITIGDNFLITCDKLHELENLNLSTSLTTIGNTFLGNCYELKELKLPESLTTIGNRFCIYCKTLKIIILPNSLITIGNNFLYSCDELENLDLPNSLTKIGNQFMNNCIGLKTVNFYCDLNFLNAEQIKDWFTNCPKLEAIYILCTSAVRIKQIFQGRIVSLKLKCELKADL